MSTSSPLQVEVLDPAHTEALAEFAQTRPLAYNDFGSIAVLRPAEPKVWTAVDVDGRIVAAAIDDGLAMSVGGDPEGLRTLAEAVPDVERKLVIAGRRGEVEAFVGPELSQRRRPRPEHFMVVGPGGLARQVEAVPLRVADESDLPLLVEARSAALEEEYGIPVPRDGELAQELERAVTRAVGIRGVAVWVENGQVAFTAQLIAKTPDAAMFGDLYTHPDLRGAGRATRALTAFCSWLMSESQHVTLRVGSANSPAVRLYERCGFHVEDEFLSSLREDED